MMNKSNKNRIKEIVVVEGRDDTAAIKRSVDALTIETHGYGIRQETWDLIAKAYETVGIIVFTDPDHAGEQIRRRIMERFPMPAKHFSIKPVLRKTATSASRTQRPRAYVRLSQRLTAQKRKMLRDSQQRTCSASD